MKKNESRRKAFAGTTCRSVAMYTALALLVMKNAQGADNWQVEGANGTLYISGTMLTGACGLAMEDAEQAVRLGDISTTALSKTGDAGRPVNFTVRLTGCMPVPASSVDRRSGNLVSSPDQPAASIIFYTDTDADLPSLARVDGITGMALRLTNDVGHTLPLNERSRPVLLSQGGNELVYTVTPVRTPAPLTAGEWQAVMNFGVRYD